jgi:hypothetical protein
VRRFCQDAAGELANVHVHTAPRLLGLSKPALADLRHWVLDEAQLLWARMTTAGDEMRLGHDGYLKLWALGHPKLHHEYILLDEAQDTNPVVLDVLTGQQSQMVYVDQHQQNL